MPEASLIKREKETVVKENMKKVQFNEAQDKDLLKDKGAEEHDDESIEYVQVRDPQNYSKKTPCK